MTGRTAAVRAVGRVMRAGAYSNRVIAAEARDLGPKDTATAHRIGYGVIRWLLRIDHAIETHSSRPMHNVQPVVWDVLRAATWEVVFGNIPNAIAVDSAVETVREMGHPRAAGFVNAVLRSLTRSGEPVLEDRALAASVPQPVLDLLDQRFGPEEADRFLAASNRDAPLQARSRPSGHQVGAEGGAQLEVRDTWTVSAVPDGWTVQDPASVAVGWAVAPEPGSRTLDMAAAPGGKTLHLVDQGADVVAMDRHARRLQRTVRRLKREPVRWLVADGTAAPFSDGQFDRVLIDAPCTGLGVIRRRPEIKYRIRPGEVDRLSSVQRRMLAEAERLVAPGGRITYSVCTVTADETVELVGEGYRPPEDLPGHAGEHGLQMGPHLTGTDGMFIAVKDLS